MTSDKAGQDDRKLLELAAKAAEIPDSNICLVWNPLTNDGDAFCLAVKLELMVNPEDDEVNVYDGGDVDVHQPIDGDPYAATRRAIVRAAAHLGTSVDIGEQMV